MSEVSHRHEKEHKPNKPERLERLESYPSHGVVHVSGLVGFYRNAGNMGQAHVAASKGV